jgi:hypothetical protein
MVKGLGRSREGSRNQNPAHAITSLAFARAVAFHASRGILAGRRIGGNPLADRTGFSAETKQADDQSVVRLAGTVTHRKRLR